MTTGTTRRLVPKQFVSAINQVLFPSRWREKHSRDVFRTFVKLHAEHLLRPFEVLLLVEPSDALEHNVKTFRCRAFEHQQSKVILHLKHTPYHRLCCTLQLLLRHVLCKVDVHANGV